MIDWAAFVSALVEVGYRGPFMYELRAFDATPADILAQIEANFATVIQPLMEAAVGGSQGARKE